MLAAAAAVEVQGVMIATIRLIKCTARAVVAASINRATGAVQSRVGVHRPCV